MASRVHGVPYEGMERDPCPLGGYPRVQRRPNPDSIFKEEFWPKSKISEIQRIRKGQAQKQFKLTDEDMCDLYHKCTLGPAPGQNRIVPWKLYFKIECQRRAWEIHGGPKGLAYALRSCDWKRSQRALASGSNGPLSQPKSVASNSSSSPLRTNLVRPKGIRLESSRDEDNRHPQETDVKSEDDSSLDLLPSTPKRKKPIPKRGHNVVDQGSTAPFQLPTPVSTVKKSLFAAKAMLNVQEEDDQDQSDQSSPSFSPTGNRSKLSNQNGPSTPLKMDGTLLPPTPSSSQRVSDIRRWRGHNQKQMEHLGTLDCNWDSDNEVRVSWIS